MAESYERLAAVMPTDDNECDLYALTSGSIIGVIHICNKTGAAHTFRVAVTDAGTGVAASAEDFLEYDTALPANVAFKLAIEGLKATSTIRIKADAGSVISFVLMGLHIT